MKPLQRLSGREVRRILERQGFACVRQKGSHMIMQRRRSESEGGGTITVPVPDHGDVRMGTLMSIIAQSRLARGLFEVR
ncbi:MAG: type II toxin-antitoxin system HicA family toxin [Planctomycetes bacterium]|nr:type II toxin-antitoxin system HicA family toxin [Planctomycetota bacterium]